jgi:hypothetical protein
MYTETETAPADYSMNCPPGKAILPEDLGSKRIKAFRDPNKFKVLDQITLKAVGKNARKFYQLNLDKFQELLSKFRDPDYNGIRAYFACYPDKPNNRERGIVPIGEEGQLTLIFVPTRKFDDLDTGTDDPAEFWHLGTDGELTPLPIPGTVPPEQDTVTRWIRHYRENRMKALEQDGIETKNPEFKETRSHWYDLKIIAGDVPSNDIGLIAFVECARRETENNPNPVVGLYIQWAAFLTDEKEPQKYPPYQLTVIFQLRQKNDPLPSEDVLPLVGGLSFGSISISMNQIIPADTGLPCPPLNYCPGSAISPDY